MFHAAPLARALLSEEELAHIRRIRVVDAGHGHDRFGMSQAGIAAALGAFRPLYRDYFRVMSHGAEHVPADGAAILAANHSGTLPLDAMMLCCDVAWQADPPRALRVVMDHFVDLLPGVGRFFTRAGGIGGSRGNFHSLLDAGELIGVFPEGVPGIGKRYSERYQLQEWRIGHAELAIRHQVPVVPVAIIGAEESWPQLTRIPIRMFGSPYLPIPATPLPVPARFHIHYGPPIPIPDLYDRGDAMRAGPVREAAGRVRDAVAALIATGLAQREGVFR
ncbi:MAG: 1-acyl-sn-glycerol-3-phosphate acyltransferase [Myxococcota bacterium]|jgi:1-acyl-sn-glycerol-3-phosphate acyltransferase